MLKSSAKTLYMRQSILQALKKIEEYPLTVVEAPMGYGKTTAVKEYLKASDTMTLWLTLFDESVSGFWNGFSRLFKNFAPATAERLTGMGVPDNSAFLEETLRIIGDIEFSAPTVIVLDDYHLLSSEVIDRFIEQLAKSELPNLHIVIISRSLFGENTTELVLKGYCGIIDKRCFELTQTEIIEYCKLCGVKPNMEDADFLHSYTEGWISAVYLCILGFLQEGRIERQASLHELIEKVVYRQSSAEVQGFLLQLCVFDNFTLEQAEMVWRQENTAALLQQLVTQNAFIRYDPVSRLYYIHNIFTSYLRRIFEKLDQERQRAIWRTAGKWYDSSGDCNQAMTYFHKAADFSGLMRAFERDNGHSITNDNKRALIQYFQDCPVAVKREHPVAALIYAINLFSFNEMELFAAQCEEIAGYLECLPEQLLPEQDHLVGEFEILCSFTQYNSITGMMAHLQRASSLMQGPARFIGIQSSWTFGSPSVLYMFYRESGQLAQTVRDMNVAMPYYCRLTAGHGAGAEHLIQAEWHYYQGDFDNAEIMMYKALHTAQEQEQTASILCALFLQLRLSMAKGDFNALARCLQRTRDDLKEKGLYLYVHTWDLCEGFIYSCLNQEKKIPRWIIDGNVQDSTIFFPAYAFVNIIRGKGLLLDGQYLKLIGLSDAFRDMAGLFPNLLGQVYANIYEAAAYFKLGRHEEARAALGQVLSVAAPDQLLIPFVENGDFIFDLLDTLAEEGQYRDFIAEIRTAYLFYTPNQAAVAAKLSSGGSRAALTEREQTIAELVASGLSNQAVGKTLHIAEVTVKKALQGIFSKWGINNRTALTKMMIEEKTG